MCPLSPAGVNTAMILFGAGCCERFFDADISLRDNGAIRKYTINYFNEMNKLTNVFILLVSERGFIKISKGVSWGSRGGFLRVLKGFPGGFRGFPRVS